MLTGLKGILQKAAQVAAPIIGNMILPGGAGAALGSGIVSLLTGNKLQDAVKSAAVSGAMTMPFGQGGAEGKGRSLMQRGADFFSPGASRAQSDTQIKTDMPSNFQKSIGNIGNLFKGDGKNPSMGMQGLAALGPGYLAYLAAKQDAKNAFVPDASSYMSATDKLYGGSMARPPEERRIQNTRVNVNPMTGKPTYAAEGGLMDIAMSEEVSYPVAGFAQGGFPRKTGSINGPGTKTSDSIPARLSDGEFVQKTDAVNGAGIMMGATNAEDARKKGADFMYALQDKLANVGKRV